MTEKEFKDILDNVKTETEFEAVMQNNVELKGKIYVDKNVFYLCHNNSERDGNKAPDRLGYRYSWVVNKENYSQTNKSILVFRNKDEINTNYNIF